MKAEPANAFQNCLDLPVSFLSLPVCFLARYLQNAARWPDTVLRPGGENVDGLFKGTSAAKKA